MLRLSAELRPREDVNLASTSRPFLVFNDAPFQVAKPFLPEPFPYIVQKSRALAWKTNT